MDMLKFSVIGSVDDGKSTLVGRLLYDTKSILQDQLEALELSDPKGEEDFSKLALLTDGLRAEREQGITIDVAYRYFATPKRKFIIADCPGHTEYTRNMVTGTSSVQASLVLIDARRGLTEQSKRHLFLSSLMGIRHLVVCVNKMDMVDYEEKTYDKIVEENPTLFDEVESVQRVVYSHLRTQGRSYRQSKSRDDLVPRAWPTLSLGSSLYGE